MITTFCASCTRATGHKRALGWGTFFAVVLTGGFWLLAIPFYQKRCMICGSLPVGVPMAGPPRPNLYASKTRAQRVTLWVMGALVAAVAIVAWLAPKYPPR